jgi:flavin-dependent dehydrogenase
VASGRLSRERLPPCDVVVVGAGPAGAAAAVSCACAGLDVTLVDAIGPEAVRKPGETLHPGVEPVLRTLGLFDAFSHAGALRHSGHWVEWQGPRRFERFGEDASGIWHGYHLPRVVLDKLLVDRAREVGVTVLRPCRALAPLLVDHRVLGITSTSGTLCAPVTVDASGGRHWLARQMGVPIVRCSPRLVAWYGYRSGHWLPGEQAPVLRADGNGWTWMARVQPGIYAWVRLVLDAHSGPVDVPPELSGLAPLGHRRRGADVTWRIAASAVGPGYVLAGDANAVLDPAASHGILRALVSGTLAAQVAARVVQGGSDADKVATAYSTQLNRWFSYDVTRLTALYEIFPAWRESCVT